MKTTRRAAEAPPASNGAPVPPLYNGDRLTQPEFHRRYEAMPEGEAVDTVTFAEAGGGTILTILVQHTSKEFRDAHINSGMEDGLQDALNPRSDR